MNGRQWLIFCNFLKVSTTLQTFAPAVHLHIQDRNSTNFFEGPPLAALTTLSFSDNVDLQRSAALAFAEITEKEVRPVGRDTLDPILFLLGSHDTEVQRAASAALGNLAVNSTCVIHVTFAALSAYLSGQQTSHCQARWLRASYPANAQPQRRGAM
jgi:hypothetical protein